MLHGVQGKGSSLRQKVMVDGNVRVYVTLNPKENTFQESAGIHSKEKYITRTLG